MSATAINVVFSPGGLRGAFDPGITVMQAARSLGVDIASVCGGNAVCGRCQVQLIEGEFSKFALYSAATHLSPLTRRERLLREQGLLKPNSRLSCQTRLWGDVVLDVPESSQQFEAVVCKVSDQINTVVNPSVRLFDIQLSPSTLDNAISDSDRLKDALAHRYGLPDVGIAFHALRHLPGALQSGNGKITVAVTENRTLVSVRAGEKTAAYGVAIDIGSTTVAAQLCDLKTGNVVASAGKMNPQIRYGDDVMSRLSYVILNPSGRLELTTAIRTTLQELISELAVRAGIAVEQIWDVTVVANPVMHHLFFGLDPRQLGFAPFALVTQEALNATAAALDLAVHPDARLYGLPCIAGHVGADAAAVVLAERPDLSSEISLIIDIGTNAEVILGNADRLLACSCPTGPAFEGAQISGGQRAAVGAIERVRIDRNTLEPRFKVIGCDDWSDQPGFGHTKITGICGSGIIEAIAELLLAGVILPDGKIDGRKSGQFARVIPQGRTFSYVLSGQPGMPVLQITQKDVRAIQLAKAALHASTRLLMDKLQVQHVDQIRLAGAFGSYIDVYYAMMLGILPECPLDRVSAAGNAAGTGARIALLDVHARRHIEQLVRRIEKIETALEAGFQQYFVDAMGFSHRLFTHAAENGPGTVT